MKYIETKSFNLSLFSLGTVQLGMDYGITGETKKPSRDYAFSMLDRALELGVNSLDTANNYGDAEGLVGEWLATVPTEKRPLVVTKIGPLNHESEEALRADIRAQAQRSLATLGVSQFDILMLHDFADYLKDPEIVIEEFRRLKENGTAKMIATSAYSYEDYYKIAASGFEAVQLPINIFDQERVIDGGLSAIANAGMLIFARSVFLQGLIFMTPETLDPRMDFAREPLERFLSLCDELDMEPPVLAASYVLSLPGITELVLGCQRISQIEENCALIDKTRHLSTEEMQKIERAFCDIDKRVVNPRLWYNKY